MKNKIIYLIILIISFALLINFASKSNANEITGIIQSEPGESQASFVARNSFKSFSCETGTNRVDGVNLNFTSTSADDVYYAYCVKTIIQPTPTVTPAPSTPTIVAPSDTATVTTPASQPVQSPTPTLTPAPSITDTSTASTAPSITTVVTDTPTVVVKTSILDEELDFTWDWEKILEWIIAWFEKIWIKL
jgi:hypothetical protein